MANYEMRKQEAIKRLEYLNEKGLMYDVVAKFKKKESELYYSDRFMGYGSLFFFNDEGSFPTEWLDYVKEFEEEYNATVYHLTHEKFKTSFGDVMECLDMFYVSNNEDEWEYDWEDLRDGLVYANVVNLTNNIKEIGSIAFDVSGGGLIRIG